MIDRLLATLAPHYCYNCAKAGTLLCDNCKYDITHDVPSGCILCKSSITSTGICDNCSVPYSRAWYAGERSGVLRQLIDGFKFRNIRSAYVPLAGILSEIVSELPTDTIVVPIPTVAAHIRERGFDHSLLLAEEFARQRSLTCIPLLKRAVRSKQRGAGRERRITQAQRAFRVNHTLASSPPYLLIDDVTTTGATLHYAAQALVDAGATVVWVAAVSRQTLD